MYVASVTPPPITFATVALVAFLGVGCSAKQTDTSTSTEPPDAAGGATANGPSRAALDGDGLVSIPSTPIRLAPPPGFEPASTFTGFQHVEQGSSILVMTIPGPYEEVQPGFNDPGKLAEKGMLALEVQDLPMGDIPGQLFRIEQTTQNGKAQKWVWVAGTTDQTVLIMGTCTAEPCEDVLEQLRESVLSAQWDHASTPDPLAGLGFVLEDTGGLEFQFRQANMISYADKPAGVFFSAGPAMEAGAITDQRGFARRRFQALNFAEISIESTASIEIDGLAGYTIVGKGHEPDGQPKFLYLAIVYEQENYWVALGSAPIAERARYGQLFETMAKSLRREER